MAKTAPNDVRGVRLSDAQIAGWAKSAGFPDDQIATAVAVALAESSGRIDAVGGPNYNGSYDYGVWQINESAHPEKFQQWPDWWSVTNANMAFAVWSAAGRRWTPWSVYNSQAYLLYMPRGTAVADAPPAGTNKSPYSEKLDIPGVPDAAANAIGDTTAALVGIGNAMKTLAAGSFKAGQWIAQPGNWIRVAQVGVGVVLLGVALNVVIRPTVMKVAAPVVSAVTKGKAKTK